MPKQRESRLQLRIKKALENDVGGFWFKVHGSIFQRAGLPDLVGCVEGIFFGLEVKTPRGRPSKLQLHTLKLLIEAGACACVVRDAEEAVEFVWQSLRQRAIRLPKRSRKKGARKS